MKASQAAIDEVRAVRLADEAELRYKKLSARSIRVADSCANCSHGKVWLDTWSCVKHEIGTRSYLICNDYERRT